MSFADRRRRRAPGRQLRHHRAVGTTTYDIYLAGGWCAYDGSRRAWGNGPSTTTSTTATQPPLTFFIAVKVKWGPNASNPFRHGHQRRLGGRVLVCRDTTRLDRDSGCPPNSRVGADAQLDLQHHEQRLPPGVDMTVFRFVSERIQTRSNRRGDVHSEGAERGRRDSHRGRSWPSCCFRSP